MWLAMGIFGGGIILAPCALVCLILLLFNKNKTMCQASVLVYLIITLTITGLLCLPMAIGGSILGIMDHIYFIAGLYNIPTLIMLLIYHIKFPPINILKTIISYSILIVILCLIKPCLTMYDIALNNLTAITNGKVYTLNLVTNKYQRPPIILNNGNSLWLNKENVEFYDYSKKKSFLIAKPDSTINFPTLLPDNNVLFTGDVNSYLFNTKALTFTKMGNLRHKIDEYTNAIVMPNNKVLFIDNSGTKLQIFDEKTGNFYSTAKPMLIMWKQQGIAINSSNKILLYGDYKEGKEYYKRVQIYDVSANKFYLPKNQPMQTEEIYPLLLKTGKVLIVGNRKKYHEKYQTYEIYDPSFSTFTPLANDYSDNREYPDLTLLNDGSVLIISKNRGTEWKLEREIFYPDSQTFKQIGHERNTYSYFSIHSKVALKDGRVMLLRDNTIVLYDPQSQIFEELGHARKGNSKLIPLDNGEILIYGGDYSYTTNGHVTIETFDLSKIKDRTKNSSNIFK